MHFLRSTVQAQVKRVARDVLLPGGTVLRLELKIIDVVLGSGQKARISNRQARTWLADSEFVKAPAPWAT